MSVGNSSKAGGIIGDIYVSCKCTVLLKNSYSTGAVTAGSDSDVGGAIGVKDHWVEVTQAYSLGSVTSQSGPVGGFIGFDTPFRDKPNHIKAAVWDLDTSGVTQGAGNIPNDPNITGVSDAQLKSGLPTGFSPKTWGQDANINNGYPYLLANPPPKNGPSRARAKSAADPRARH